MKEKIERYQQLRKELLEVEAELASRKLAYLSRGHYTPLIVRVAIESRRADLRLEVHNLRPEIVKLHEDAKTLKHQAFLHRLVELCNAAGHQALVEQARGMSRQALEAAGQGEAYSVNV